jgi:hypothetical protein
MSASSKNQSQEQINIPSDIMQEIKLLQARATNQQLAELDKNAQIDKILTLCIQKINALTAQNIELAKLVEAKKGKADAAKP